MRLRLLVTSSLLAVCLTGVGVDAQQRRGGQPGAPPGDQPPGRQAQQQQQPPGRQAQQQQPAEEGGASGGREVAGAAEEKISTTSHSVTLDGKEIKYTATTGTLPIRLDDGKVAARLFFVAYAKDGEEVAKRPISFLYNGGPGAATVWLHMGSFAPRHVQMADEGFQPSPPYKLVNNPNSLIDATDLVFVDAVDTGYSRGVAGVNTAQFHGQNGDIRAFGEFVNEYLTAYSRWPSPKFLIGESYGTIRSAGLAQELQSRHGIELNGIVLVSALLTYQTLSPAPNNDIAYADVIPTYAATAWYHKKLSQDLQREELKKVVDDARVFALGEYMQALTRGNTLPDSERKAIAQKLAHFTGVSAQFIEEANLRINSGRFRKELLRDQRLMIGRLDSRFTGMDVDAAGEVQEFDPSNTALQGAYTALFQDYVRKDLKWESDLHYPTSGNVRPWTYDQNRYMDETEALRSAMTRNPYLKVLVACGYYDMATPLAGIEFNVSHLAYDAAVSGRFSFAYYEAGHMIYIRPSAHKALKQDIVKFIHGNSGPVAATPTQQ